MSRVPSVPVADPHARTAPPKPRRVTAQTRRRRKATRERPVRNTVREACVERDGHCAVWRWQADDDFDVGDRGYIVDFWCDGPSEWAHLRGHRRSQTRNMAPERRHTTTHSLMLCHTHHAMEEQGRLRVRYLTDQGCDGPIQFTVKEK